MTQKEIKEIYGYYIATAKLKGSDESYYVVRNPYRGYSGVKHLGREDAKMELNGIIAQNPEKIPQMPKPVSFDTETYSEKSSEDLRELYRKELEVSVEDSEVVVLLSNEVYRDVFTRASRNGEMLVTCESPKEVAQLLAMVPISQNQSPLAGVTGFKRIPSTIWKNAKIFQFNDEGLVGYYSTDKSTIETVKFTRFLTLVKRVTTPKEKEGKNQYKEQKKPFHQSYDMKSTSVRRGNIYHCNLGSTVGSEQGGNRFVLVVQNDLGNRNSPTTIIAPLTSKLKRADLKTHVNVNDRCFPKGCSVVLLEQIRTVDSSRLDNYVGKLSKETMRNVDIALMVSWTCKQFQ